MLWIIINNSICVHTFSSLNKQVCCLFFFFPDSWGIQSYVDHHWFCVRIPHLCNFHIPLVRHAQTHHDVSELIKMLVKGLSPAGPSKTGLINKTLLFKCEMQCGFDQTMRGKRRQMCFDEHEDTGRYRWFENQRWALKVSALKTRRVRWIYILNKWCYREGASWVFILFLLFIFCLGSSCFAFSPSFYVFSSLILVISHLDPSPVHTSKKTRTKTAWLCSASLIWFCVCVRACVSGGEREAFPSGRAAVRLMRTDRTASSGQVWERSF